MVGYRCYILDAEGRILQAYEIECEDDAQAESAPGTFSPGTRIIARSRCGSARAGS
jgi:hypothetical protein